MEQPLPGQRWVSDSEPELGLGVVMKAEFGRLEIFFPAASEHRQYALKTAPLRRVHFLAGDTIKTHDGFTVEVESVEERNGMLFYIASDREVSESELSDTISFSKPEDLRPAGRGAPAPRGDPSVASARIHGRTRGFAAASNVHRQ
jgi:ATP-dependent helicase HepA